MLKIKLLFPLAMSLFLTGCLDELNANLSNKNIEIFSAVERHEFVITSPSNNFDEATKNAEETCISNGCQIIFSFKNEDSFGSNGIIKAWIPSSALASFAEKVALEPSILHKRSMVKGTSTIADIKTRVATKKALRDSLLTGIQKDAIGTPLKLIALEKDFERLQSEIEAYETLGSGSVNDKVLVDIKIIPSSSSYGFDFNAIKRATFGALGVLSHSLALAITFTALILPWLPAIMIFMWLLSIVFKSRVTLNTTTKNIIASSGSGNKSNTETPQQSIGGLPFTPLPNKDGKSEGSILGKLFKKGKDAEPEIDPEDDLPIDD